ncbi:WecB/TagA/CpsF family glycosyltransferase [Enterococcus sp. LJL98]
MTSELIMGVPVDKITYEIILEDLEKNLNESNKKMTIVSVNPQVVLESKKYPEVVEFIKTSTHRIPDGIGIVLVSKLTGGSITERVAGFDMMVKLLEYGNKHYKSAFFYGASPVVLEDMLYNLKQQYPNLKISGGIDGYTTLRDEEIVKIINKERPDFLFVAMGVPKQEIWLSQNYEKLDVKVFQDVGGSFDVLSGHVKRAPQFYINYHLEWLYRSISNPKRISRIFQLPVFIIKSLQWKWKKQKR